MILTVYNSLNKKVNLNLVIQINKYIKGERRKLFCILESQLINIDGMMELEKSPFGKHSSNNSGKKNQWLMKLQGERRMRNGFYIVSECLPRRCHINQVIKVNTV